MPTQTAQHKREAVSAPHQDHPGKRSRPLTQSPHHTPPGELLNTHLSSHPHVTTANEESGSYSSLTAEVTPQSVLTLLCPWTRKSQHTSDKGYTGVQHPSRKERSMTPQHSFCTPGMTIPPHCTKLCCKNPNTGRSRSWRFDNKRPGKAIEHDMLREEPYGRLCRAAMQGKLRALLGGHNCRTWWFPKPGAPQPVRRRHPDMTWGLPGIRLRLTYMIFPQADWGFVFVE